MSLVITYYWPNNRDWELERGCAHEDLLPSDAGTSVSAACAESVTEPALALEEVTVACAVDEVVLVAAEDTLSASSAEIEVEVC